MTETSELSRLPVLGETNALDVAALAERLTYRVLRNVGGVEFSQTPVGRKALCHPLELDTRLSNAE